MSDSLDGHENQLIRDGRTRVEIENIVTKVFGEEAMIALQKKSDTYSDSDMAGSDVELNTASGSDVDSVLAPGFKAISDSGDFSS